MCRPSRTSEAFNDFPSSPNGPSPPSTGRIEVGVRVVFVVPVFVVVFFSFAVAFAFRTLDTRLPTLDAVFVVRTPDVSPGAYISVS